MALENTLVPKNWRDRGGGFRQPQAAPVAPAAADTGMRPVGFRNTGAIREQGERTAALAAGAASVGEPTSFRGGAGAPEPIAVMRGTATTYSPGVLPGHQFAEPEVATPLQAQQTWNRGMRGEAVAAGDRRGFTIPEATLDTQYGGFRETGQTGKEIAASKEPPSHGLAWQAQAKLYDAQREGVEGANRKTNIAAGQATLRKQLEEEIGIQDPKTGNFTLPTDPALQGIHKKMDRLAMQGVSPEEAYKAVAPELHKHYYTPENLYGAIGLMEKQTGQPVPPELRKQLMSGTPEAMEALYPFTRQAAQQPRGFVARTLNPVPGRAATQPTTPAAVPATAPTTFRPPGSQPFAGAAEQGEAAGEVAGAPVSLGPGFGKPLGGVALPDRY